MGSLEQNDPYANLSPAAREKCIRLMMKAISRKPRTKRERIYINSLTGKRETPESFWQRARSAAERVIAQATAESAASHPRNLGHKT